MKSDDIEYILELLNDAINDKEWDLVEETIQFLDEFRDKKIKSRNSVDDD